MSRPRAIPDSRRAGGWFPLEPRGLQREIAARYVGVSPGKFDEMVKDGRMPQPRRVDGRKVWDRFALDTAFEGLPTEQEANPWDDLLQ